MLKRIPQTTLDEYYDRAPDTAEGARAEEWTLLLYNIVVLRGATCTNFLFSDTQNYPRMIHLTEMIRFTEKDALIDDARLFPVLSQTLQDLGIMLG